jgi:hypothetical protein
MPKPVFPPAEDDGIPRATWFQVTVRYLLFRGQPGPARTEPRDLSAQQALAFILRQLPEDAARITYQHPRSFITIDWSKVPLHLKEPEIPARNLKEKT